MNWCLVETPDGRDEVRAQSMAFDGGSLILFEDAEQRKPVAAYSPYGWLHWRWLDNDERTVRN